MSASRANGPRDSTAFELREALREPGCAVCQLTLRSVVRQLKSIAYEQVNDVGFRDRLRRAGGFCNPHAYLWLREARSVLGTALVYRDLLKSALRDIDDAPAGFLRGLRGRARDAAVCPACDAQVEAEGRFLSALLEALAAEPELLDASDGLCRRHTLAVVRSDREAARLVARHTRAAVEALLEELDEVIRKEDYRFRDERRTEGERTAPARGITWQSGIESLADVPFRPTPRR